MESKKKLAPLHGSVINHPLIPTAFERIMLPVLHIVLGIVKKLWDNLVQCIQQLESKQCKDIFMLKEAHENFARHVSNLMERKDREKQRIILLCVTLLANSIGTSQHRISKDSVKHP